MTTELITIVEIDQAACSLTYGSAPCMAALGTTGAHKCFNTFSTCQDTANYNASSITLRFFSEVDNPPKNLQMLPLVRGVNSRPTELNIVGGDPGSSPLGKRAKVTVRMADMPYHDRLVDKYWRDRLSGAGQSSGAGYNPADRGTFWSKWLTRNPNYANLPLRVRRGTIAQATTDLSSMQTEHYIIDSIDGPGSRGEVTITAKDVLALADNDRAVAPAPSPGRIQLEILADDEAPITVTLLPEGAGEAYADELYGEPEEGEPVEVFFTSKLYPIEPSIDAAEQTGGGVDAGQFRTQLFSYENYPAESAEQTGGGVAEGVFRAQLLAYTNGLAESAEQTGGGIVEGVFRAGLIAYTDGLAESAEQTGGGIDSGVFRIQLISYADGLAESAEQTGGGVVGGSHAS